MRANCRVKKSEEAAQDAKVPPDVEVPAGCGRGAAGASVDKPISKRRALRGRTSGGSEFVGIADFVRTHAPSEPRAPPSHRATSDYPEVAPYFY